MGVAKLILGAGFLFPRERRSFRCRLFHCRLFRLFLTVKSLAELHSSFSRVQKEPAKASASKSVCGGVCQSFAHGGDGIDQDHMHMDGFSLGPIVAALLLSVVGTVRTLKPLVVL